jgi:hypothetical protein
MFREICAHGDSWGDNFKSLENLFYQLWSLSRGTDLALRSGANIVVFVRPDLLYYDSFRDLLRSVRKKDGDAVYLPIWQPHGGYNDRFAVCVGETAIRLYGHRINEAKNFCQSVQSPLNSEQLLKYALNAVPVNRVFLRGARVRVSGAPRQEDFSPFGLLTWARSLAGKMRSAERKKC